MKKILSILIAISLIISLLPAAFAEGEESVVETYSFTFRTGDSGNIGLSRNSTFKSSTRDYITRTIKNTEYYLDSKYFTYATDLSVGNWKILDVSNDIITSSAGTASRFRMASSGQFQMTLDYNSGTAPLNIAFALKAPATAGFYIPTINYYTTSGYGPVTSDSTYKIFFDLLSEEKTLEDYSNAANEAEKTFTQPKTTSETAVYLDNEDDLVIAIKGANDEYRFKSVVLTQICNPTLTTSVDTETMTASVTVSGKTVVGDTETTITNMPVSNNFITYKSANEDIATVDPSTGVITAVKTGTANIYAVSSDGTIESEKAAVNVNVTEDTEDLSGVTIVYDISGTLDSAKNKLAAVNGVSYTTNGATSFYGKGFSAFDYAFSDGFFEYAANSTSLNYAEGESGVLRFRATAGTGRNGIQINEPGNWIAFKIKVPVSGKYKPKATYWKFNKTGELYLDYYLIKDNGESMSSLLTGANISPDSEWYVGSKLSNGDDVAGQYQDFKYDEEFEDYVDLEKGEYYLVYSSREVGTGTAENAFVSNFTLDGGEGSAPIFSFKSSADEITADKTTANVTASAKLSNPTVAIASTTKYRSYTFANAPLTEVTYSVAEEDAEVAEINGNVVTGKSYGVATINASAKYGDETLSDSLEISVITPPSLDGEITYEEKPHLGGKAAVTTYKFVENTPELIETKSDIALGSKVKVSADETIEKDGTTYNFLYWAKGATMARKQIVSFEASFDYLPGEGSNFLIAVYEPETEVTGTKVEFYNGNGQLLPTYTLVGGKLPDYPSMAGYGTAYGWALKNADGTYIEYSAGDDVSALSGNLMFAAMYGEKEDITVFVDGAARNVKYGDKVTCTPDASKGTLMYWMKDGSVVSLEDTYSFLAWEDCRVEAVYGTEKPELSATKEMRKIVLDRFAAGEDMAIMAEFIGFDDAVEKGIMFGNQKIAMSSKSSQFTVIDDATTNNTAYGYAIIPDGAGYKILTDGIAHIGVDDETIIAARRNAAESYMRKMTSVLWSPAEDITYSTGTSSAEFTLYKDRIYQGLPYVYTSGTYEGFMEFANDDDEDGVYTVTGLTPEMMKGSGGIAPIGNDCSGALVRAWSTFGANIQAKTTKYMNEKYGFLKVGDYELLESDYDYSNRGTTAIANANGEQRIYEAYAKLQKADAVVHYPSTYGHSMMVFSVNVVRNLDGSINGASSTIKVHEQTKAYYKDNATTEIAGVGTVYKICGVEETYKFNDLYATGYLPITCRELVEATYIEDVRFNDTLGEESHTLRNLFNGTISCNKAIDEVKITITGENGTVQSAASTVKRGNIFVFEMGQFTEFEAAKIRGNIDVESLASGEYTCTVQVRLVGETQMHTVRDFIFTK